MFAWAFLPVCFGLNGYFQSKHDFIRNTQKKLERHQQRISGHPMKWELLGGQKGLGVELLTLEVPRSLCKATESLKPS